MNNCVTSETGDPGSPVSFYQSAKRSAYSLWQRCKTLAQYADNGFTMKHGGKLMATEMREEL